MSDEQVRLHFEAIRQRIMALQPASAGICEEIDAALEDLQVIYEQMQASLEAAELIEAELLQRNQQITGAYEYYYNLFHQSPIAHLVTDRDGVILEANCAIANLLKVPQHLLIGKPLILYVAAHDRSNFYANLNQHSEPSPRIWQTIFAPRGGEPVTVELHCAAVRYGTIETLRIGVYVIDAGQPSTNQQEIKAEESPAFALPQALDGLRVLVVDDDADVRELIKANLESYGIGVQAVANAAAALEAIAQFRPNVLVSDLRMPGADGHTLIRQIRELETKQGWHLPAAAITAYLDEDREKSLQAGYDAYLHKLAQPIELIELVVKLAGRGQS